MSRQDHVIWQEPTEPIMLKMPEPLEPGDPESIPVEKLLEFFAHKSGFTLHAEKPDEAKALKYRIERDRKWGAPAPIITVLLVTEIGEMIKVKASTFEEGRPEFVVNLSFAPTINNAGQVFSMIF